ncbi:histidine phosphatase family protein [Uliginosibacterium sp. 31-12]|uniref:histidine phosphatase family protein n=1 Tax=Uliginosibacterium sp. 31-12 TaxID=3062781 RepID=UPI0026E2AC4D|nr:histidine phosphatase family protein [Uliginosibacterium sp. 31-12]MDO6385242.1 histidine phosphatase family protein [Uliginosibacterium sp. 31-12]
MPPTRICLVRHGETAWNAEQRLQGHEDISLNARGLTQAIAAAQALSSQRFAAIYCSDLQRAAVTAATIAALHGTEARLEPRFRERHFGALQGLTRTEAEVRYPGLYPRIRMREPATVPPDNGESLAAFAERISSVLLELALRHPGEDLLVVSHGGCMDIMYRLVTGKPLEEPRDFPLSNATLNWISYEAGNWALLSWDERSHLQTSCDEISA